MTRKFRYGNPTKGSRFKKWSTVAYLFLGWNALGLLIYQYWRGRDPDAKWDKMSSAQKYLYVMGTPEKQVKVLRIEGFKAVEKKDITVDEFTDHYRKPGTDDRPIPETGKTENCEKSE